MSALSIAELVYEVMQWLDLPSVLQLGRTHRKARLIAAAHLNRHVKLLMRPYVGESCEQNGVHVRHLLM